MGIRRTGCGVWFRCSVHRGEGIGHGGGVALGFVAGLADAVAVTVRAARLGVGVRDGGGGALEFVAGLAGGVAVCFDGLGTGSYHGGGFGGFGAGDGDGQEGGQREEDQLHDAAIFGLAAWD